MATNNQAWNLESFLDSLTVELDKARETLAVKAINRPLTYTVKDMALDLQIFPTYDGDEVRFTTAQPGQEGASKLSVQLASITDQQVRATSKPVTKDDMSIDSVDIDSETKKTLRKIGVTSVSDLKEIEQKNVDLEKVSPQKKLNYGDLINRIEKAKRDRTSRPKVQSISRQMVAEGQPTLVIQGENLAINQQFSPVAAINNRLAEISRSTNHELHIALDRQSLRPGPNDLVITLDPYSIIRLTLNQA